MSYLSSVGLTLKNGGNTLNRKHSERKVPQVKVITGITPN